MPGSAAPVAREIAKIRGAIELLETQNTVEGQVAELVEVLKEHTKPPAILVGHSWGTVLSLISAVRFPELVKKLVLIGTPALEIKDRPDYQPIYLSRLSENDRIELMSLQNSVLDGKDENKSEVMGKLFRLICRADSYDFLLLKDETLEYQLDISVSVGGEFHKLLKSGELLMLGGKIKCAVVEIHGDFDLRTTDIAKKGLSGVKDFKLVLLEKCGHYPWMERYARDEFYKILKEEILS
jgi:pimeloyl-ACP methyl ester carboxylesterase